MKLRDIFNQLKYQIKPDPEAIRANIINEVIIKKQKLKERIIKFSIIGLFVALLVLFLSLFIVNYFTFDTSKNISGDIATLSKISYVAANDIEQNRVSPTTDITVVTTQRMSASDLKDYLSTTPEVPYSVKKTGINRFNITFEEALSPDTSYTINSVISGSVVYRWSLQTSSAFAITACSPTKNSENVDINSTISVTFSESSVDAFQEYFKISPAIEGEFYHKGRIWNFKPSQPLKPYTTYTVTISKEIHGVDEKPLNADLVFSFTTGLSEDRYAYAVSDSFDITTHFLTTQTPYTQIFAKGMTGTAADITIYKLPDADTYLSIHKKYNGTSVLSSAIADDIKSGNYALYSQFSASAIKDTTDAQKYYFNYPKELESGYYISVIKWEDITIYQLIHSADLAVYTAAYNGEYVTWVNNAQNKTPVSGATVQIGSLTGTTDQSGLATVKTTENISDTGTYVTVKSGNLLPHILYVGASSPVSASAPSNYYYFLYTDREEYASSDTVKVWGVVLNKNTAADVPSVSLYAEWSDKSYPIVLAADGSFTAELPIDEYFDDFSTALTLRINDQDCYTQALEISDLDMMYSVDFSTKKFAYFSGETAMFDIKAEYENKIPVSNLTIESTGNIVSATDQNGKTAQSFVLNAQTNDISSCDPQMRTINLRYTSAGDKKITYSMPLIIFNNSEFLQASIDVKNGQGTLKINTNQIDLTKLNGLSYEEYLNVCNNLTADLYQGAPVSKEVTVELHEIIYERAQSGTYYDATQQKILNKYTYNSTDNILKTINLSTTISDGSATENITIPSSKGIRYIKIAMTDSNGKECYTKLYLDETFNTDNNGYEFVCNNTNPKVGDKITLSVSKPAAMQYISDAYFICHLVGQNSFKTLVGNQSVSFDFTEELASGITVYGSYFDGKAMHPITPVDLLPSVSKETKVNITAKQKEYLPGDTVSFEIKTTDAADKAVSATYKLCLIAPATFDAESNDTLKISFKNSTQSLFSSVPYEKSSATADSEDVHPYPAATVLCSGITNENGIATATFKLPNTDSKWMVAVQTVTADGTAGYCNIKINAQREHYLATYTAENVTPLDDAVISYLFNSSKVPAEEVLNCKVSLYQAEQLITVADNITTTANTLQYHNFGKLTAGSYLAKIVVSGSFGNVETQQKIVVTDSPLAATEISAFQGEEQSSSLLLTDAEFSVYTELLNSLLNNGSSRIDNYVGSKFAQAYSKEFDLPKSKAAISHFLSAYQTDNGGFSALTKENNSDLFLTVRLASLFPEQIDSTAALSYFDSIFTQKEAELEEILLALWGKAALHQAVEKDLAYYYAEGNGFTKEQYLCFAIAYAYGGNQTKANEIFTNRLLPELKTADNNAYLEFETNDAGVRYNAMLSMLLTRISSKYAQQSLNYVIANDSDEMLAGLETLAFVQEYIPALEGQNAVQIALDDGTVKDYVYNRCIAYGADFESRNITSVTTVSGTPAIYFANALSADTINSAILPSATPYNGNGAASSFDVFLDPAVNDSNYFKLRLPTGLDLLKYEINSNDCIVSFDAQTGVFDIYTQDAAVKLTVHYQSVLQGTFVLEPTINLSAAHDTALSQSTPPAQPADDGNTAEQ